jgi:signal transduction histidine kinase
MEECKDTIGMLDLMIRPAFAVKDGKIHQVNAAAKSFLLQEGTDITELLVTGKEEYPAFNDGCLYLTLGSGENSFGASVTKLDGYDIFVMEQDEDRSELQAMALAAQELRSPLSNVMTVANRLYPVTGKDSDPALQEQVARINRGLYQMLRIIGNMSDAYRYCQESVPQMETRNICSLVSEIFQSCEPLIRQAQINLEYTAPQEQIFCLVDAEKLERAIHNMLSNSIKFAAKGACICATLTRKGNMLYLTVQDNGTGVAQDIHGNVYSRYLRQPGIEDGRYGIGLGMVLIRAAAAAHGGTVLMENSKDRGTKITMTIAIKQKTDSVVRAQLYRIDYAGEKNHPLIELSESLPLSAYQKDMD